MMRLSGVKRKQAEIDRVIDWAMEGESDGSHYPGMSYENGILAALEWLFGDRDESPDE